MLEAAEVRRDRLVSTQASASALSVIGALSMFSAGDRLGTIPGGWGPWTIWFQAVAVVSAVVGVAPWLSERFSVRMQRALVWGATCAAVALTIATALVVDLRAPLGCQALLTAGVVAELGTGRRALRWCCGTAAALVLIVVAYHMFVGLRPTPE